jgi:hypothetical protein
MKKRDITFDTPAIRRFVYLPYWRSLLAGLLLIPLVFLWNAGNPIPVVPVIVQETEMQTPELVIEITQVGDELQMKNQETIVMRAKKMDEDTIHFFDEATAELRYKVLNNSPGFTVVDQNNQLLNRVKYKSQNGEKKFNVYDANEKRLFSGKFKKGRIRVRDSSGNLGHPEENGLSLFAVSAFYLDVPNEVRSLIGQAVHLWIPQNTEEDSEED